jgi:hypothetical protein
MVTFLEAPLTSLIFSQYIMSIVGSEQVTSSPTSAMSSTSSQHLDETSTAYKGTNMFSWPLRGFPTYFPRTEQEQAVSGLFDFFYGLPRPDVPSEEVTFAAEVSVVINQRRTNKQTTPALSSDSISDEGRTGPGASSPLSFSLSQNSPEEEGKDDEAEKIDKDGEVATMAEEGETDSVVNRSLVSKRSASPLQSTAKRFRSGSPYQTEC